MDETYNDIVTKASPQFEKPMSRPLARPLGEIFSSDVFQSMYTRGLPVISRFMSRTRPASSSLMMR